MNESSQSRLGSRLGPAGRHAEIVSEIAGQLLIAPDPRPLLGAIFRRLAEALGEEIHLAHLATGDGPALVLEHSAGLGAAHAAAFARLQLGQGFCPGADGRWQPLLLHDLQESAAEETFFLRMLGARAYACHPLNAGDRLLGTFALVSRTRARFDEEELRFIALVCNLVAAALERARLLRAVEEARDAAERASRAKDDFLAVLSHELRTPLNPVLLVASDAAANQDLPPEVRADFDLIARNVTLEARLIDDLLDLTHITHGKLSLDRRVNELHGILQDAIVNISTELGLKEITLDLALAREEAPVMGDAMRLQQVFWNLLKNAVKFTDAGGRISMQSRLADGQVEVAIADNGIGMTPQEIDRVFNAFAQGDHAGSGGRGRFGGLGLGLAIARMLVELHFGSIRAFSAGRGRGSTFTVILPLAPAASGSGAPASEPPSPAEAALPRQTRSRILVVEDHEPTRTALAHLLARRQHEVVTAATVVEARALADTAHVDLIIADIGLPDGNGYELMRELHRRHGLRGIALTGYGTQDDIARSRSCGFFAHLTKPIRVQALDDALALLASAERKPPAGDAPA